MRTYLSVLSLILYILTKLAVSMLYNKQWRMNSMSLLFIIVWVNVKQEMKQKNETETGFESGSLLMIILNLRLTRLLMFSLSTIFRNQYL